MTDLSTPQRDIAKYDQRYLDAAIKDFAGTGSVKPGPDGSVDAFLSKDLWLTGRNRNVVCQGHQDASEKLPDHGLCFHDPARGRKRQASGRHSSRCHG